jgi:hypothetical protein
MGQASRLASRPALGVHLDKDAKAGGFAYEAGKGWSLRLLRSVSADYTCGAGELSGPAAERWSARTVSLLTRRSSTSS